MILMMNGYTAVGKSSLALFLSRTLSNFIVLHTAVTRKELRLAVGQKGAPDYQYKLDDEIFIGVSSKVYKNILEKAEGYLDSGNNVILDGTYNFTWQRSEVYKLALNKSVPLVIVRCLCSNELEIRRRLNKRALESETPLAEANEWETYLSTKQLSESINGDVMPDGQNPHIIEYDSFDRVITRMKCETCKTCKMVQTALRKY